MVLASLGSCVDALFAVLVGAAALMTLLRIFELWAARHVAKLDANALARSGERLRDSAARTDTGS